MINYLSRRCNPTPHLNFMPPEMQIFGTAAMLSAIQQEPPDFIAVFHRRTREYGVGPWGSDPTYGQGLMEWVAGSYQPVWQFGGPERRRGFVVKLLKWKKGS